MSPLGSLELSITGAGGTSVNSNRNCEGITAPGCDHLPSLTGSIRNKRNLELVRLKTFKKCTVVRIEQGAISIERAVLDNYRNLKVVHSSGIAQRRSRSWKVANYIIIRSTANYVKTRWSRIYVETCYTQTMIMIPQRCRPLFVWILACGRTRLPWQFAVPLLETYVEIGIHGSRDGVTCRYIGCRREIPCFGITVTFFECMCSRDIIKLSIRDV